MSAPQSAPEICEGGSHHFVPRGPSAAREQACQHCGRSAEEIRNAAPPETEGWSAEEIAAYRAWLFEPTPDESVDFDPTVIQERAWIGGYRADRLPAALDRRAPERHADFIDIVFDGPPAHVAGRFVEVQNSAGASISVGDWVHRADGYWVLRVERSAIS